MIQTVEQLELPAHTYYILEQMAQARSITLAEVIEDLVRQYQVLDSLSTLRQEYQQLTEKVLMRTVTREEEKRLDAIYLQMSVLNRQINQVHPTVTKQREKKADELIAKSEHLLELAHQQSLR